MCIGSLDRGRWGTEIGKRTGKEGQTDGARSKEEDKREKRKHGDIYEL